MFWLYPANRYLLWLSTFPFGRRLAQERHEWPFSTPIPTPSLRKPLNSTEHGWQALRSLADLTITGPTTWAAVRQWTRFLLSLGTTTCPLITINKGNEAWWQRKLWEVEIGSYFFPSESQRLEDLSLWHLMMHRLTFCNQNMGIKQSVTEHYKNDCQGEKNCL